MDVPTRRFDLNEASAEELQNIDGIDGQQAHAILEYRASHGAIQSWDELAKLPGFDPQILDNVKRAAMIAERGEDVL